MPSLAFRRADPADIPALRTLAERIWRASYAELLAPAQIDYMLHRMYGADTIAAEMMAGTRWDLVEEDGQAVGFQALSLGGADAAELHKLYLLPDRHGRGFGQRMLRHAEQLARHGQAKALRLRVNKGNARALRSYERAGFIVTDALVADIGGGFVMDDYVLSLSLPLRTEVKICGLSTADTLEAALQAGAAQIGLVFFPKSPRHVALAKAAALAGQARGRAAVVALTVDADDDEIDAIVAAVSPDWLQLHGRETPERVEAVRRRTGTRIMKAVGIATAADIDAAQAYVGVADRLLFDAKPSPGAALPGGNGIAFDWTLLRGVAGRTMLSGGLTPDTVAKAIRISGATAVDVSSGVERAPGVKDEARIAAFVAAAHATPPPGSSERP